MSNWEEWQQMQMQQTTYDAAKSSLLTWLRDVVRPDTLANVTGVITQEHRSGPYDWYVYARRGTGKLKTINVVHERFATGKEFMDNALVLAGPQEVALVGVFLGDTNEAFLIVASRDG